MTTTRQELSSITKRHVPSVPAALKSLALMEKELETSRTYDQIRKIVDAAQALKILYRDIDVVRYKAEDTVREATARIGEEIKKIPKAKGGGQLGKDGFPSRGKSIQGRSATGIPHTSRQRYQKLASVPKPERHRIAQKLRSEGKDATVTAVVREITHGDKKKFRDRKEADIATKIKALPTKHYGVIYADPPWPFEVYSDDGSGRSAKDHYPTMTLDKIKTMKVPASSDCVLFLWATVPRLPQAFEVMEEWDFRYRSNFVWVKNKIGLGRWNRNKHEHLLIGVRGNIPAPTMGTQFESAIVSPRERHSAKPAVFREMIEKMFPSLPRLEMFARGKIEGWDCWGAET
jgi:N6-adenosine-specific RNA methylase IME4